MPPKKAAAQSALRQAVQAVEPMGQIRAATLPPALSAARANSVAQLFDFLYLHLPHVNG